MRLKRSSHRKHEGQATAAVDHHALHDEQGCPVNEARGPVKRGTRIITISSLNNTLNT